VPKRYRVEVAPLADRDIRAAEAYIAKDKPRAAAKWAQDVYRKIASLATFPLRCERVPEGAELPLEFRQLLFGNYRIIFRVDGYKVYVMRVYHAARLLDPRVFESEPRDD
jgi:toxin ParE1/3/4